MNDSQQTIIRFIERFHGSEDVFLHGCCLWFALILCQRFQSDPLLSVYYDPVEGHFVTKFEWSYYDIRGDVTDIYASHKLVRLRTIWTTDKKHYMRLMRDCRDFIDPGEE